MVLSFRAYSPFISRSQNLAQVIFLRYLVVLSFRAYVPFINLSQNLDNRFNLHNILNLHITGVLRACALRKSTEERVVMFVTVALLLDQLYHSLSELGCSSQLTFYGAAGCLCQCQPQRTHNLVS